MSDVAASDGEGSVVSDNSIAPAEGLVGNSNTVGQSADDIMGTDAEDYSYVPEKFRAEGEEPNWQKLSESYTNLEKQFHNGVAAESVEDYSYEFKDNERMNMEAVDSFKEQALEKGLSADQFGFMMNNFEAAVDSWQEQAEAEVMTAEKGHEALSEIWGDDTDANIQMADKALMEFAPEGIDISKMANDPNVILLLHAIGEQMGEDAHPLKTQTSQVQAIDEQELADLRARPDYWSNPEVQRKAAGFYAKFDR